MESSLTRFKGIGIKLGSPKDLIYLEESSLSKLFNLLQMELCRCKGSKLYLYKLILNC